ncbi:MAG: GNAT family N-acetyltransferase [Rudanella sp.]|nr:GNAT family N-acetyltransferase [Rudanella sp.]
MTIRNAAASDAEAITSLAATTMREAFGPPLNPMEWVDAYIEDSLTLPQIRQELTDPRSLFFVVESETGELAGYAKVRQKAPPRRFSERHALEIQRIYLLKNQIGDGRGKQLMNHCLAYGKIKGFRAVYLGVWERNEHAIQFYERQGFKPFGWHVFQFGPDRQRDIWMGKAL